MDANGENPVFYEGELEGFSFIRWVPIFLLTVFLLLVWQINVPGSQVELLLERGVNHTFAPNV